MNLPDMFRRLGVVLSSVVTLCNALAAVVTAFVIEVAPELPNGWEDDATRIGGAITAVLLASAAAIRRLTEVPPEERGILPK